MGSWAGFSTPGGEERGRCWPSPTPGMGKSVGAPGEGKSYHDFYVVYFSTALSFRTQKLSRSVHLPYNDHFLLLRPGSVHEQEDRRLRKVTAITEVCRM